MTDYSPNDPIPDIVRWCDGSVRFVPETIALDVWWALGTPDGDEVVGEVP